jgi:ssDNA-binding Zn-finger/Zn-ribbon topoisomerase 1
MRQPGRLGPSAYSQPPSRDISKLCPDCGRNLQLIRILDCAGIGPNRRPNASSELTYALPESSDGMSTGIPPAGKIKGWMCPKCHRVLLYAEPNPA